MHQSWENILGHDEKVPSAIQILAAINLLRFSWDHHHGGKTVCVRIVNSLPLGTWAQEWDSNPDPDSLQAAIPMDQGAACLHFPETELLQAEAPTKSQSQNTCTGVTMVVPKKELPKLPNKGRESSSVNFMNLKSSQVTNQIQSPKEKMGFRPNP
ncbi:hypothetical protein DSO57_1030668 [Entomophthora muscae]|uniref:Uncharacterized protein n=1 Tax=Entomophthora muscae TaxID=34485 RepID=A0ACC2ULN8_9FUNG|nr:hypothetical protein DSO57_1030668 [Entomophthora muscae]